MHIELFMEANSEVAQDHRRSYISIAHIQFLSCFVSFWHIVIYWPDIVNVVYPNYRVDLRRFFAELLKCGSL